MSGMDEVLTQLFSKNKIVLPSNGREVEIKKVTLRTMKPVMDLIATVLEHLNLSNENLPTVDLQNPAFLLKLISNHFDQTTELASKLCSLTLDELLDLETDESVLVVGAIIALNKDFFTKKVLPNLRLLESTQQS
jgi:hypothetical protein